MNIIEECKANGGMVDIAWADTESMRTMAGGPDGPLFMLSLWIDLEMKVRRGEELSAEDLEFKTDLENMGDGLDVYAKWA